MKNLILTIVVIALTAISTSALAASKSKKNLATVNLTATIDCHHCVEKVMNFMPYQKGVKNVEVDLPTKQIEVEYDVRKADTTTIIKYLKKIDIDAQVTKTPVEPCKDSCCE